MRDRSGDGLDRLVSANDQDKILRDGDLAFNRWLTRGLRDIRSALSRPVPQNLLDLIQGHRKITK